MDYFSSHVPFLLGSFSFTCHTALNFHLIVDVNILDVFIFPRMYLTIDYCAVDISLYK